MTAKELIELLEGLNPDTEVFVKHTSGDYWNTELASEVIDGNFDNIVHSDYHRQDKIADSYDDNHSREVFVLHINQSY